MTKDSPRYVALLAAVSAGILILGSLLKPAKSGPERSAPSQAELVRLERLSQRQALIDISDYFADTASRLLLHFVRADVLESSGVVWGPEGRVVAANTVSPPPLNLSLRTAAGSALEAELLSAPPMLPVTVLQTDAAVGVAVDHGPPLPLDPGDWILAVWRPQDRSHSFSPGYYLGSSGSSCGHFSIDEVVTNIPLNKKMQGGGLFDLDGNLIAIVVPCGDRHAAISIATVEAAVAESLSAEGRLLTRYGLRVTTLSEAEQVHFEVAEGMLVAEIWHGYPAAQAGLYPGDIIQKVDGQAVSSGEDLAGFLLPVAREVFNLELLRAGSVQEMALAARPAEMRQAYDHPAGLVIRSPEAGFPIRAVAPGSAAARAGVRPGDRLLAINGAQPLSAEQAAEVLSGASESPVFLVFRRDGRLWGTLLG